MKIRQATREDLPEIVSLLKRSLGESRIPKSEEAWNWKHVQNPFGESLVYLAFEGETLVGVRAFMQWRWHLADKEYRVLRAVDTATHPEFWGRGIFRKLTEGLIEKATDEGFDFIFNTPNEKSMPGYLKMGWKKLYKVPVRVRFFPLFCRRLSLPEQAYELRGLLKTHFENLKRRFFSETRQQKRSHAGRDEYFANEVLGKKIASKLKQGFLEVPLNDLPYDFAEKEAYFKWRYVDNPLVKYHGFSFGAKNLCIFRVKKGNWFNELRICDLELTGSSAERKEFNNRLREAASVFKCRLVTVGRYGDRRVAKLLNRSFFGPPLPLGLQLTARTLNSDPQVVFARKAANLPLGTFELF